MDELIVRAITAYYRNRPADEMRQPGVASERVMHQGKGYVLLRDAPGAPPLAIYRCMNRGELKRLKRWPAELVQHSSEPPAVESALGTVTAMPVLLELVPVARKEPLKTEAQSPPGQAGLF